VLDIASVVDEAALQQFLAEADIREISLRRTGMPTDIADAVEFSSEEAEAGKLELKIKPASRIKQVQRGLVRHPLPAGGPLARRQLQDLRHAQQPQSRPHRRRQHGDALVPGDYPGMGELDPASA
jgi:hypothetical protein